MQSRSNDAVERITKISVMWGKDSPLLNEYLLRSTFINNPKCKSLGIGINRFKSGLALHYNPEYIASLTDEQLEGALLHEIFHLLSGTFDRGRAYESNPEMWNMATDYANNYEIHHHTSIGGRKIVLPEDSLMIEDLKDQQGKQYEGKVIADDLFYFIRECQKQQGKDRDKDQKGQGKDQKGQGKDQKGQGKDQKGQGKGQGSGKGQKGQGGGNQGDEETDGDGSGDNPLDNQGWDDHSYLQELQNDPMAAEIVKEITASGKMRGYGNLSGNLVEKLDALGEAKIPFYQIIHLAVNSVTSMSSLAAKTKRSWRRMHRKFPDTTPGKIREAFELIVAVDTSGSISPEMLKEFFGVIDDIAAYANITLYQFDCDLQSKTEYKKGAWKTIKVTGRGGTDPQCVFDEVKKSKSRSGIVFLTDGEFSWRFDDHQIPSSWVVYGDYQCPSDRHVHRISA